MDPPTITTQPLRASENPKEANTLINSNSVSTNEVTEKDLTEVTAVFDDSDHTEMTEEEKEKRRQRSEDTDCCCVYSPYYSDDGDAFCLYVLCNWICDCFRGIGHCTENCFEGCANCLGECCEGDGCCCDCDAGDAVDGNGCGDCLSGCIDCCTACDCDCSACSS